MKILNFSLLLLLSCSCTFASTKNYDPKNNDLTWTTPSSDSFGSMPLGNGDIGLNVWVEPSGDLFFYISKVNAFDADHLLPKLGKVRVHFTPSIDFKSFKQTLCLEHGTIVINTKDLNLELMVSATQSLIALKGNSKTPRAMNVSLEPLRPLKEFNQPLPKSGTVGLLLSTPNDELAWCYRNQSSVWENNFRAQNSPEMVAKVQDPLLYRTSGCLLKGTNLVRTGKQQMKLTAAAKSFAFTIHVNSSQPSSVDEWLKSVSRSSSPDWKGHYAYWKEFWNRSYIHISSCGDKDVQLDQCRFTQIPQGALVYKGHNTINPDSNAAQISQRYALERFCEAIASRGEVPPPYNGSIFTMDMPVGAKGFRNTFDHPVSPDGRDWAVLSFMGQNTRHPYWSMAARGDFDCLKPGMQFALNGLDIAKDRCRKIFGFDGAVTFEACWWHNVGVFNWDNMPQHLRFHQLSTLEIPSIMTSYYEYTRDSDFLNHTLVPYATEAIKYYANRFPKRDQQGKMVMADVGCVETYQPVTNPCTEIGGLKYLLSRLLSFTTAKAYNQNKSYWRQLLAAMPPVPLRTIRGQQLLAVGDPYVPGREICESPELYSVYPFKQAWLGTPKLLSIARQSFHLSTVSLDGTADGQAVETGGWQSTPVQAACLGLPREAARLMSINFNDRFVDWRDDLPLHTPWPNRPRPRFPAFWECKMDGTPDNDHGANSESALQNMLLQADGNKIYLLPAWPENWDVSFKLHAPAGTTVECVYKQGKVSRLVVSPTSRAADIIDCTTAQARIRTLTEVACCDHNYLFNLPPMLDAQPIPGKTTASWIARYGETLRDCKAGPWPNAVFKDNVVYIHVFDWPKQGVSLPRIDRKLVSCTAVTGNIQATQTANGWLLQGTPDPEHTIVKLTFDAPILPITEQQIHAGSLTDGMAYTESRDSASLLVREVNFPTVRTISRFEFTIDNPHHLRGEGNLFRLQTKDDSGKWSTVYEGQIYGLICAKAIPAFQAKAVRLVVDASRLTQFDLFPPETSR